MTRSTSSQTSVTPGFASILSPFLLLLSPASVLPARVFASDGRAYKNVTTGVKKTVTVMDQGGSDTNSAALPARSVCQSVINLSIARQPRQLRPWPSQQHTHSHCHTHTHLTHTFTLPSISQSSPQVWQTGTYPSCLCIASGENVSWRMTSNDKSKVETAYSTEKSVCHLPTVIYWSM